MPKLNVENGKEIYYEDHGAGDTALLLIHGWGMSLRTWDYSLQALVNEGLRVVLLDHRCCGASDKDFQDRGISAIADDVVGIVQELNLAKVVVNGWSLGGAVATASAERLGEICSGLALTCGASPVYLQKSDFPHGGTEDALAETVQAINSDRVNFLYGLSQGICATEVTDQQINWMWEIFMQASPSAVDALAELGPLDQREILANLDIPIVSFVGSHDVIVDPEISRSVANYGKNVRLVEMKESGHAPFIDETELYNSELIAFVKHCFQLQ